MARMFQFETGQWIDIPDEHMQAAYESGEYAFAKDSRVNVELPSGEFGSIGESELPRLFESGGRIETGTQRTERMERADYSDMGSSIAATALALGRGATFGLSDNILEGVGAFSDEELEKLQKYNPYLSGAGELAGAIAPALLSGGAGALGTAARLLPAGASSRVAVHAGKLVGSRLGVAGAATTSGKLARGGVILGTEAGVEGLLAGGGYTVSEDVFGDSGLTAEEMMGKIGSITMMSAGLGGVFGVGVGAMGKAYSAIAEKASGSKLGKWARNAQDELAAAMSRGDVESIKRMRDPKHLDEVVFEIDRAVDAGTRDATTVVDDIIRNFDDVSSLAKGEMKREAILEAVPEDTMVAAVSGAHDFLQKAQRTLADMLGRQGEFKTAGMRDMAAMADRFLGELVEELEEKFAIRIADSPEAWFADMNKDVTAYVFNKLDDFKKNIGGRTFKAVRDQLDFNTYGEMKKIFGGVREFLEDGAVFGAAADMQQAVNAPFSEMLNLMPGFLKTFATRYEKRAGRWTYVADPKKIKRFIKDLADESKEVDSATFKDMAERYRNFVDAVEGQYGAAPGAARVKANMDTTLDSWGELTQKLYDRKEYLRMLGATDWAWTTVSAGVGYGVGGPLGVLTGYAIDSVIRPGQALRKRAMVYHFKQTIHKQVDRGVSRAIKRMVDNTDPGAPMLKAGALPKLYAMLGVKKEQGEDARRKRLAQAIQKLEELNASGGLVGKVDEIAGELSDFPNLQSAVSTKVANTTPGVLAFMPKTIKTIEDPITGKESFLGSDSDVAAAEQVFIVSEHPISAISDGLANGTLTKNEVRAFRAFFPKLYQEYRASLMIGLQKKGKEVSEQDRIKLSTAWDFPATPSMQPVFIAGMQAGHESEDVRQPPGNNANALRKQPGRATLPLQGPMISDVTQLG